MGFHEFLLKKIVFNAKIDRLFVKEHANPTGVSKIGTAAEPTGGAAIGAL
jgi:hypothetical protein